MKKRIKKDEENMRTREYWL